MLKAVRWNLQARSGRTSAGRSLKLGIVALSVAGLVIASQDPKPAESSQPANSQAAATSKAAASSSGPAEYVGSETCQACHEDIFKSFLRSRHHTVEASKGVRGPSAQWAGKACESCHGPGSKHAESTAAADIVNPSKVRPGESERICLGCHKNTFTHSGRIQGGHGRNQVACVSCHSIHKPDAEAITTGRNKAINAECASCHLQTWAEFQRPHKHRLPEGAMSCVDCHNPHGSFLPRMVDTVNANEPSCIRCHSDKRGPFTFEHPPVKLEGCKTCHAPHGSVNPRMLTRHEERFVCLECHANVGLSSAQTHTIGGVPPAFHDLRSTQFQNCSVCHIKTHGSQVDRSFLK
jgi:DmsE family decaheme c-type cytochrome